MIDKECSKVMDSKCPRDYKSKHYWERRGVIMINGYIYTIRQCTQCEMCIREKLTFLHKW